jgi:hypothetical protein
MGAGLSYFGLSCFGLVYVGAPCFGRNDRFFSGRRDSGAITYH